LSAEQCRNDEKDPGVEESTHSSGCHLAFNLFFSAELVDDVEA
jgi:hypothetical protein